MRQYKIIGFFILMILFTSCGSGGSSNSQTSQSETQSNSVSINDNSNILSTPSMPESENSPDASSVAQ